MRTRGHSKKERIEELLRKDVDREPVSHDVNRGQVQSIMRTFTALVSAHLSHLTADQTIRTSNLGTLLDDAITTVVPDGSEDDFTDVGRAMMAVRIRADGSGQGDEDDSDDERPSPFNRKLLPRPKSSVFALITTSLSRKEADPLTPTNNNNNNNDTTISE